MVVPVSGSSVCTPCLQPEAESQEPGFPLPITGVPWGLIKAANTGTIADGTV